MTTIKRNICFLLCLMPLIMASCWDENEAMEATPSGDLLRTADVVLHGSDTQGTIHVEANCQWTIATTSDWLSLGVSSGQGSDDVTITTSENPWSDRERAATVTLTTASGISRQLTVRQEKNAEQLSVSPGMLEFSAQDTGSQELTISANGPWSISGVADWVTLSPLNGTGKAQVRISVSENEEDQDRTDTLIVMGDGGASQKVTVKQTAKSVILNASPTSISATAIGASYAFSITGNMNWTLSWKEEWIQSVSAGSGYGDKTISFACANNQKTQERSDTIWVISTNQRQKVGIAVRQQAAEPPIPGSLVMLEGEQTYAVLSCTVTSMYPILEYGICYGNAENPTADGQSKVAGGEMSVDGTFSATITGLTAGATYHVRAYARSVVGINYSPDFSFSALSMPGNDDNERPGFSRRK